MSKIAILILCALAYCTHARPSLLHSSVALPSYEHIEYTPTVIGHTVHTIPTAISHQSQTIVHEKRPYLRPIIEHSPIVKSYTPTTLSLPISYSAYSPLTYSGLYDNGWSPSWNTAYSGAWSAWPIK